MPGFLFAADCFKGAGSLACELVSVWLAPCGLRPRGRTARVKAAQRVAESLRGAGALTTLCGGESGRAPASGGARCLSTADN